MRHVFVPVLVWSSYSLAPHGALMYFDHLLFCVFWSQFEYCNQLSSHRPKRCLLASLPNSMLEAWNWPWYKYSHHRWNFGISNYLEDMNGFLLFFLWKVEALCFFLSVWRVPFISYASWILALPPLRLDLQGYFISAISDTLIFYLWD